MKQQTEEYIKHIRHTHEDKKKTAWCGQELIFDWAFVNIDHVAYNNMNGGRLLPCKKCVEKVIEALEKI